MRHFLTYSLIVNKLEKFSVCHCEEPKATKQSSQKTGFKTGLPRRSAPRNDERLFSSQSTITGSPAANPLSLRRENGKKSEKVTIQKEKVTKGACNAARKKI
jgi:predicted naringenin-chalcone synthase